MNRILGQIDGRGHLGGLPNLGLQMRWVKVGSSKKLLDNLVEVLSVVRRLC